MRTILNLALCAFTTLVGRTSVGTARREHDTEATRTYSRPYDAVWESAVKALHSLGFEIASADKADQTVVEQSWGHVKEPSEAMKPRHKSACQAAYRRSLILAIFSQTRLRSAWKAITHRGCFVLGGIAALTLTAGAQTPGAIPPWPMEVRGDRVLGPYLWRGIYGPDAILASVGEEPRFDWQRLVTWSCGPQPDVARRARCVRRYMDDVVLPASDVRHIGAQRTDIPDSRQYTVQFRTGERNDVWLLQGATALPVVLKDGSKIESECVEDLVAKPLTPWGGGLLAPPSYSHGAVHDCLRYFRRVLPNESIAWSNVFLVQAAGALTDRTESVTEDDPVLELFDLRAVPTTDFGILRSWISPNPRLSFGAVSVGVDLVTGKLLSHDSRLVAKPSSDVAALYSTTLRDLLRDSRINARNTASIIEGAASESHMRLLGKSQRVFDEAIRKALVETYFKH